MALSGLILGRSDYEGGTHNGGRRWLTAGVCVAPCRGVHCIVPKWMFNMSDTKPYTPLTMAGSSKPANVTLLTSL